MLSRKRLPELDGLKALGAFFVLMYHSQALSYGVEANILVVWGASAVLYMLPTLFLCEWGFSSTGKLQR